ncbi:MAG: hypothetical protein OQK24_10615 [Magnetovibrio sp.]|nr:hypothetical protein [Magnetovibrio sp.]
MMGYFDGLTDAAFKKNDRGDTVFYPWGIFGNGYILDSEETGKSIKSTLKRLYIIVFSIFFIILFLQSFAGIFLHLSILISLPIIYLGWHVVTIKRITSGLATTKEKLRFSESLSNSAKSHNLLTLYLLLIASLVLSASGFLMLSAGDIVWGAFTMLLFGYGVIVIGKMIRVKKKTF